jgi:hypothetical protein
VTGGSAGCATDLAQLGASPPRPKMTSSQPPGDAQAESTTPHIVAANARIRRDTPIDTAYNLRREATPGASSAIEGTSNTAEWTSGPSYPETTGGLPLVPEPPEVAAPPGETFARFVYSTPGRGADSGRTAERPGVRRHCLRIGRGQTRGPESAAPVGEEGRPRFIRGPHRRKGRRCSRGRTCGRTCGRTYRPTPIPGLAATSSVRHCHRGRPGGVLPTKAREGSRADADDPRAGEA